MTMSVIEPYQATTAADDIRRLAPWFQNLHLPDGSETAPNHHFGDFPRFKWLEIAPHIPADLTGKRVLDLGCNAGFYSIELARRGATVVGIDINAHYLRQARWAAAQFDFADRLTFERGSVYGASDLPGPFDIVVFMGLFYHLRYPLMALDAVAQLKPDLMIFQTLTHGDRDAVANTDGTDFNSRERLSETGWPRMAFIETDFSGDLTNWWIPNRAGVLAMLASAGFRVVAEPGDEIFLCHYDPDVVRGWRDPDEWSVASGRHRYPPPES
jgi:tRNA (mo5U34)-methyltransferase